MKINVMMWLRNGCTGGLIYNLNNAICVILNPDYTIINPSRNHESCSRIGELPSLLKVSTVYVIQLCILVLL